MTRGLSQVHFTGSVTWGARIFREIGGASAFCAALGTPLRALGCVPAAWCGRSATTATPTARLLAAVPSAADAG